VFSFFRYNRIYSSSSHFWSAISSTIYRIVWVSPRTLKFRILKFHRLFYVYDSRYFVKYSKPKLIIQTTLWIMFACNIKQLIIHYNYNYNVLSKSNKLDFKDCRIKQKAEKREKEKICEWRRRASNGGLEKGTRSPPSFLYIPLEMYCVPAGGRHECV